MRKRKSASKPKSKRRAAPEPVTHDSVGGETVGGVEVTTARRIADEHAIEAMQTVVAIMREPGRGGLARLAAAKEVLRVAGFDEDGQGDETGDGELSPADLQLMKRFLEERAAKEQ